MLPSADRKSSRRLSDLEASNEELRGLVRQMVAAAEQAAATRTWRFSCELHGVHRRLRGVFGWRVAEWAAGLGWGFVGGVGRVLFGPGEHRRSALFGPEMLLRMADACPAYRASSDSRIGLGPISNGVPRGAIASDVEDALDDLWRIVAKEFPTHDPAPLAPDDSPRPRLEWLAAD